MKSNKAEIKTKRKCTNLAIGISKLVAGIILIERICLKAQLYQELAQSYSNVNVSHGRVEQQPKSKSILQILRFAMLITHSSNGFYCR